MPGIPGLRLVNSIRVQRILIDDTTKAMYKREDAGTEFFYLRDYPPEYCLTEDKIMYVFVNSVPRVEPPMSFFDKFGIEWNLLLDNEVKGVTYLGVPITRTGFPEAGTSSFGFRTPVAIPRATPSAPPMFIPRPSPSAHRVSFADERMGPRPMGSGFTHASSGHPAMRVPTGPLPTSTPHTPLVTTNFKNGGSLGGGRNKTRPSHFQKWVKKFSGSGDPYDHLASFR